MLVTEDSYTAAVATLTEASGPLVCDTETTGLDYNDRVCGIGLRTAAGASFYFPFRHAEGGNLPLGKAMQLCRQVLRPDRVQVGFNYGFDLRMLHHEGLETPRRIIDAQTAAHLLNENEPSLKMENLAAKYLDADAGAEEDALIDLLVGRFGGSRKKAKGNLWKLPAAQVAAYAEKDLETTWNLWEFYENPLKRWGLIELFHEYMDYQLAIFEACVTGLGVDVRKMDLYAKEAAQEAERLEKQIQEAVGWAINPRSSVQMQAWLGVPSTSADTLATLDDPRAKLLLEYRSWAKVESTYYRRFREYIGRDGRLHPNLNVTGTKTGRLSCSRPNLQSIPRSGGSAYKVKDVFVASPGKVFVEADYSQAEVRVMAHYSQDERLRDLILSGENMHDVVSREQQIPRPVAKALNFSAQYGIGAMKFAATYGYGIREAREYLSRYKSMFQGIPRLYHAAERRATEVGYIRMYSGRIRRYNAWKAPTYQASAHLVQGSTSEMVRRAVTQIWRDFPEVRQMLFVHDSTLFEIPEGSEEDILPEVKKVMEDQPWCTIPIVADIKVGKSWGSLKEWAR